jgi:hypothetical protein
MFMGCEVKSAGPVGHRFGLGMYMLAGAENGKGGCPWLPTTTWLVGFRHFDNDVEEKFSVNHESELYS